MEKRGEFVQELHELFNSIITEGKTYPHETIMDIDSFQSYFQTAFLCIDHSKNILLGAFYIKPNFPGRSSHICNGGFIVSPAHRGRGVGTAMGEAFLRIAPQMGFKASIFNLVYENNLASVNLWKKLGFQIVGRVPQAGRLVGSVDYIDALVFYFDFHLKK